MVQKIKDLIETALAQRPDYKAIQKDVLSAQNQITVAKSDGMPSLSGNLGVNAERDIRDGNRAVYGGSAGLTLSFPLFTGFSRLSKIPCFCAYILLK